MIYSFFSERPCLQNLGLPLIYFFHLQTTIRQKYIVLFHLIFLLYTAIQPKIMVLIDLFLLCAHDHSTETYGPVSFILSLVHENSTKNKGPHWFASFICARPFVQKLGSSLIYLFHLYMTIRPEFRVAIDLFLSFANKHSTKI